MTVRFLADEDLDADIIEGLRSREAAIDILDVKVAACAAPKIQFSSNLRPGKIAL